MSIIQELPFFINPLDDQPLKSGYLRHYSDKARLCLVKQYSIADGWIYPALPGNALPEGHYSLFNADHLRLMDFQEWRQENYREVMAELNEAKSTAEAMRLVVPREVTAPPMTDWEGTIEIDYVGKLKYRIDHNGLENSPFRHRPGFSFVTEEYGRGLKLAGAINLDKDPMAVRLPPQLPQNLDLDLNIDAPNGYFILLYELFNGESDGSYYIGWAHDTVDFSGVNDLTFKPLEIKNIPLEKMTGGSMQELTVKRMTINHKYPIVDLGVFPRDSFTRVIPADYNKEVGKGDVYRVFPELYNQDRNAPHFMLSRFNYPCTFYKDKNGILYWAG